MNHTPRSSRQEFERLEPATSDNTSPGGFHGSSNSPAGKKKRERSALELVRSFWGMLQGYRRSVIFALTTLTLATLLALIPPAATKFIVDYVLGDTPLPANAPAWIPESDWHRLLLVSCVL